MKIVNNNVRSNLYSEAARYGFNHYKGYWDESQYYQFSLEEIENIENVTNELHALCLDAVDRIMKDPDQYLHHFLIEREVYNKFIESWENHRDIDLYGRMDLGYSNGNIKLIEYNADTPTSLWEAAIFQWEWMQHISERDNFEYDQFNSIHDRLTDRFSSYKELFGAEKIFLLSMHDAVDDRYSITYFEYIAKQVGFKAFNCDIGVASATNIGQYSYVTDKINEPLQYIIKLYPWEWMMKEEGFAYLVSSRTGNHSTWINPLWKMLLSSKAILPILWKFYPNHPNLLPAYFQKDLYLNNLTAPEFANIVLKPIYSREGQNVSITQNYMEVESTFHENNSKIVSSENIIQEYFPLTENGKTTILGSWLVAGESAGLGIRQSDNLITDDRARFVPHVIV